MRRPTRAVLALIATTLLAGPAGLACATGTAPTPAEPITAEEPTTATPPEPVAPSFVFLVRHAEKAQDGTKDPPLTGDGRARAVCLARVLGEAGVSHVFSTDLQRTEQTVRPLADRLGLQVTQLPASDTDVMVSSLRDLPPGSVAVVAGHSNTLPEIVDALGGAMSGLDANGYIEHETYDRMIEVVIAPAEPPRVLELRFCAP